MAIQDSHPGAPYYYPQPASDSSAGGTVDAADVTSTPAGNIAATNVQDALNELDTEKYDLASNDADDVTETADRSFINPDQVGSDRGIIERARRPGGRMERGFIARSYHPSVSWTFDPVNVTSTPAITGPVSTNTGQDTDAYGDTRFFGNMQTTAAINARGGFAFTHANTTDFLAAYRRPYWSMHIKIVDVADVRIRLGMAHAGTEASDGAAGTDLYLLFRFSTAAGDTKWQAQVADGSGHLSTTDTGVTVTANTAYHLEIDWTDASQVVFKINGTAVATISSNLPANTSPLMFVAYLNSLAAAAKSWRWGAPIIASEEF